VSGGTLHIDTSALLERQVFRLEQDDALFALLSRLVDVVMKLDVVVLIHRCHELCSDLIIVVSLALDPHLVFLVMSLLFANVLSELLDSDCMLVISYILLHHFHLSVVLDLLIVNCQFQHFDVCLTFDDIVLDDHGVLKSIVKLGYVKLQLLNLFLLLDGENVQVLDLFNPAVKFLCILFDGLQLGS
jgi:hypothetical protein